MQCFYLFVLIENVKKKINKWQKYAYAYKKMTGHAWSDEFSALVWKFNGIYTSKVFFQIFEEEIFRVWYSVSQYLPTCDFLRQSSVLYHVQNISWLMFHRHVNVKQRKQVLLRLHLSSWHFRWNKSYLPSCFWSRCYFCFYEITFQIRLLYIFIIFIQNFQVSI